MSVSTLPTPASLPYAALRPFSVEEYHRMIEVGILTEQDKVELIRGYVIFKNPPHKTSPFSALRPFSVAEYHQMIGAEILTTEDKVELLNGYVVLKMPRNPPHDTSVMGVFESLRATLPVGWTVRSQCAVTLAISEPEPDAAVVRGTWRDFKNHHPYPPEIGLVVQVSDSSLRLDRGEKGLAYSAAGIPMYWIVNVVDQWIEVYTEPTGAGQDASYAQRHDYRPGDSIPLILDGITVGQVAVRDLLG